MGSESDVTRRISEALVGITREISAIEEVVQVRADPERILEAASKLRELGFDHVKAVTAVDLPEEGEIEVVYHISSLGDLELARTIVALRTRIPRDDPRLPSLSKIWPSALYQEREEHEMLGVVFEGHPNLGRLLLPEDFEGIYPLRKDFKVRREGIEAWRGR